jgi:RimJ/RimL family protein N-acetyltransferase
MRAPELLESDRLLLRRPVTDDAEVIFATYCQDPEVTRYLTWKPHRDIDETRAFLLRCDQVWDQGASFPWAITLKESGRMAGMIEARVNQHQVGLGYVLARDVWGNGFATEAVRTVVGWALSEPSVWRVWALTDVDNASSARVLEKAGMSREGLLHRWASHPNVSFEPRDC